MWCPWRSRLTRQIVDLETEGSSPSGHPTKTSAVLQRMSFLFVGCPEGLEQGGRAAGTASKATARLCLARGCQSLLCTTGERGPRCFTAGVFLLSGCPERLKKRCQTKSPHKNAGVSPGVYFTIRQCCFIPAVRPRCRESGPPSAGSARRQNIPPPGESTAEQSLNIAPLPGPSGGGPAPPPGR